MYVQTHDGLRLYVETHGPGQPLLYLHGGPGAGSLEFAEYQADRLGSRMQVICLDQRGVHRSDALAGQACTLANLVADCEAVRIALGIERWSILAHDTGALVALNYAAQYPERVTALILECPSIDVAASQRSLLLAAADLFEQEGDADKAARARLLAEETEQAPQAQYRATQALVDELGELKGSLMFQAIIPSTYDELLEEGLSAGQRARTREHVDALLADPALFAAHDALLGQIQAPVLVVRGRFDPICPAPLGSRLQQGLPQSEAMLFAAAAHFPHVEEANRFAHLIGEWLGRQGVAR